MSGNHEIVTARRIVVRQWLRAGTPFAVSGYREHAHAVLAGRCDHENTVQMALAGLLIGSRSDVAYRVAEAAGALVIATDGQSDIRPERLATLHALEAFAGANA